MEGLEKLIEQVAADLVMVSPDDLPAMAAIHEKFLEIARSIDDREDGICRAATGSADIAERLIFAEMDARLKSISVLKDAVVAMQEIVRDKRAFSEVHFPRELELGMEKSNQAAGPTERGTRERSGVVGLESETPEAYVIYLENADAPLLSEFINEAREHCTTAEQMMMELECGQNIESTINAIFRSFHTIKGAAGFLNLKPIMVLAHESETLLDLARKGEITIEGAKADLIFDAIDKLGELLENTEKALNTKEAFDVTDSMAAILQNLRDAIVAKDDIPEGIVDISAPKRLGELLVRDGIVDVSDINDLLAQQMASEPKEKLGTMLVKSQKVPAKKVAQSLRQQRELTKEGGGGGLVKDVVKVDTERLDKMINTIGELVIAESLVGQDEQILALDSPHTMRNISHLNKITRELQEMGMAMRLVPMKGTFQKLNRAIRDLAKKSKKQLKLVLSGEDTEVDKGIADQIGDPLLHMVRNSVDHGIETADARIRAGKPAEGQIKISAYHKGGNIYFDIDDDGRGLDKEKILAKAREKGIIDSTKELTEKDIYNLIAMPGFSTAKEVTNISGRGVGMDVVRRNVEAMRGHLEIENYPGQGTKFSIRLPLTLAVIDGMLVDVSNEKFIIPTLSVLESLKLTKEIIHTIRGRAEMINLRGEILPLLRIDRLFNFSNRRDDADDRTVVVVQESNKKIGLVVDRLLGQRQIVIKSLGSLFSGYKWISGGAVLSNGKIGLILDVNGLLALSGSSGALALSSGEGNYDDEREELQVGALVEA